MNLVDLLRSVYDTFDQEECDTILYDLCRGILEGQRRNPEYYGMVAACVLGPEGQRVYANNHATPNGQRVHAERSALDAYAEIYGRVPKDAIIITTLSPCSAPMDDRYGLSCTQLIDDYDIRRVYCGYEDPTQIDTPLYNEKSFEISCTSNQRLNAVCRRFAETFLDPQLTENFADGKGPGRPGDSQRHGIPKGATIAQLEKAAKAPGRKGQLARWQLNMRRGKKK
jgi:pyrimidine deaminase RibD-like protein